jgi:hypothetical protein
MDWITNILLKLPLPWIICALSNMGLGWIIYKLFQQNQSLQDKRLADIQSNSDKYAEIINNVTNSLNLLVSVIRGKNGQ